MASLFVDGKRYEFDGGQRNLLDVCLSLGLDLPYFCWHPAMHSVGACRQCAVKEFKDENDTRGRIVMACMTPAKDGARISIDDPEAKAFRKGVIEWMMVNHPHDCPVCDEGGECHLQDMTCMTGHDYRRYRFRKRTYRNQDLGPFLNHEMNRCIQCYRCVRFYRELAGGRDLNVFGAHDAVYFGRTSDGALESEYAGNLAEICPTGVFTDKTLGRHYTRKWDLQTAPSVCVHCAVGCNTEPGERYGLLRRIRNRYHHEVNGYFLCDRGRYGYEFVNDPSRPRAPMLRDGAGVRREVSADYAVEQAGELLKRGKAVGIGSPRASLEANLALRALVGEDRFFWGIPDVELSLVRDAALLMKSGSAKPASLLDASRADAVFILGEDVPDTAPMLAFYLRQAAFLKPREEASARIPIWDDASIRTVVQGRREPFIQAVTCPTRLSGLASTEYLAAPSDLARFAYVVAGFIVSGNDVSGNGSRSAEPGLPPGVRELALRAASDLSASANPVIVSGTGCLNAEILDAAAAVAEALSLQGKNARIAFVSPECNSLAAALVPGGSLEEALSLVKDGSADTAVILENDLTRRLAREELEPLYAPGVSTIVLDCIATGTTEAASLVLPSASFAESDGILVNYEGRLQQFFRVFIPSGEIRDSRRRLASVAEAAGIGGVPADRASLLRGAAERLPGLSGAEGILYPASLDVPGGKIPRQSRRWSGRTAIEADRTVNESAPAPDPETPFAFSMEGFEGRPPAELIPRYWAPGWNSVQALNKFQQEVGGPLQGKRPDLFVLQATNGTTDGNPRKSPAPGAMQAVPEPFAPDGDTLLVVPSYHVFGSEELSSRAPGVASLAPPPHIGLSFEDAERLALADPSSTASAEIVFPGADGGNGFRLVLPVKLIRGLPAGIALLPKGLPGIGPVPIPLPGRARVKREGAS